MGLASTRSISTLRPTAATPRRWERTGVWASGIGDYLALRGMDEGYEGVL